MLSYGGAVISTNATIIRKAYDDFAKGDIAAVLEAFDASITWHVPGHSPLSGDYKGHDEVVGFSNTPWHCAAVSSLSRCSMSLPKTMWS
jgi:ketosteroid isomerase-like protein